MTGTIKSLVANRQYGFIKTLKNEEYFFHKDDFHGHWEDLISDFHHDITIRVQFESVESKRGLRAGNVRRIGHPDEP